MRPIVVEWGGRGQQGVQTIMGLGADEVAANRDETERALERAGWISVGVWAIGTVANKRALRAAGIGGAAVAFLVRYVASR